MLRTCYIPNISDKTSIIYIRAALDKLTLRKRPFGCFLAGDFNHPGIDWLNCSLNQNSQYVSLHKGFLSVLEDFSLIQYVLEPTSRKPLNILDLIITNLDQQISNIKVIPGISDHDIPTAHNILMKPSTSYQKPRKIWLYAKANWDGMRKRRSPY